jgi:putative transcriptional regulator
VQSKQSSVCLHTHHTLNISQSSDVGHCGFQQALLGDLAGSAGVTRQSINAIERERYDPSLELALKLADDFDCAVEALFWLD